MADDQKPKTMDINDLVRELSKSSTSPVPAPAPEPQASRPSFPTPKPAMPSPAGGSMASPAPAPFMPKPAAPMTSTPPPVSSSQLKPQFNAPPLGQSKPTPAPSPVAPLPTSGVKEYQSSIRTMNEDISKIKQGQKPTGIDVPRKVEQVVPVPQVVPPKPTVPGSQFKVPSVNLGETQKTAPMAPSKTIPSFPSAPKIEPKSQIYVPQERQKGGNRNVLFLGIGAVAIVAGFAYWFFVLRLSAPEVVIESPTPTPTQVPTSTPLPLERLGIAEKISIPSTSVFLSALTTEMNTKQLSIGQIRLFDIVDENQQKYSFKEFLSKLSIDTSMLNDSIGIFDNQEWVLGLYGQLGASQGSSVRPFIVLTQKDSTLATGLMNTWEPRIINDLAKLFNLSKISAKLTFTSDTYSGVNFRFVRIPDKDLGVAYAIIQDYLVLGSSRDSFRAVISVLALKPD
jgi:hypothetical protein